MDLNILQRLSETLAMRKQSSPDSSYVAALYAKGTESICKKIAEEAAETIMAAKDGDAGKIVYEIADVWFHTLVLLTHMGLSADDILIELARREGVSGIEEKNNRSK